MLGKIHIGGYLFLYLENWTDAEQSHRPQTCDHLDEKLVTMRHIPALQADKTAPVGGNCLCLNMRNDKQRSRPVMLLGSWPSEIKWLYTYMHHRGYLFRCRGCNGPRIFTEASLSGIYCSICVCKSRSLLHWN